MIKPHLISILHGFTALIFGSLALFDHSDSLDISIYETYFVIAKSHLWMILMLLFVLFTGISLTFRLLQKQMNWLLSIIHYLLTLGCIINICLIVQKSQPTRYYDYSVYQDFNQTAFDYQLTTSMNLILYIFFAAQIIFMLNVILSTFKKNPK